MLIYTPVLAFAVSLLKFTMPNQPLSSRLSLAQAVVSLNSRTKAVSLGIASGDAAKEGWGSGQPKVNVMGREVAVLKRGGYDWKSSNETRSEEKDGGVKVESDDKDSLEETLSKDTEGSSALHKPSPSTMLSTSWAVSQKVSAKDSTFVARSREVKSSAHARRLFQELMAENAELRQATHNVTAWRVENERGGIIEEFDDDGETGGGLHVLKLMQSSDVVNYMVVMSRWYGGTLLYNLRWELMAQVCRDALSQRLRVTGTIGQEPLWGLDLEGLKETNGPLIGGAAAGMPIHKPESARQYILRAFASVDLPTEPSAKKKKKTGAALELEKEHNLGLFLGALDILFGSWAEHISREELDRRAWTWYVQIRPNTEWGGKGEVHLADILNLRRNG